jgi:crotonobetainyl-CoA:carnitine CoA-transferase CaiB-like acyl-CoA transferase
METDMKGMLSPYRVLDLTDEKGWVCGKIMGDLGADVIKIEPPGGDPGRNIGPFYHDEVDPEKSLYWFAFNTSKRGITLDIEKKSDKEVFRKLVKTADFVIESFSPGYLDKLGLGYSDLEKLNPGLIMVSISPFGQTGPYKDYKASDIIACAMGGHMLPLGDADRPPVGIGYYFQGYLHAGAASVVGALMALNQRRETGQGQHIDVSMQEAVSYLVLGALANYDIGKIVRKRGEMMGTGIRLPTMWPCKDGLVVFLFYWGEHGVRGTKRSGPLVKYMSDEGMADEFLKSIDFSTKTSASLTREEADKIEKQVVNFFMTHTKAELFKAVSTYDALIYPVATVSDMPDDIQLASRKFWVDIEHPELGANITYPGAFTLSSEAPPRVSRRAPLIGEHNKEIFEELRISDHGKDIANKKPSFSVLEKTHLRKPLEGVKVVDFTWVVAGPLMTKVLADYGAEVVTIEGKTRTGGWRTHPPFMDNIPGFDRAIPFLPYNTSKHSIALNHAKPKGKEFVKKLVAWADIVIDNYSGGSMDRMGFGYEELKKVNPDIIMFSACMMGQTGPLAAIGGDGNVLTAMSGYPQITGWPDRLPVTIGPYTDYIGPHYGLASILAALDYRERTGKGQRIDLSQYETGMHFLAPLIMDWNINKKIAVRAGNHMPFASPHSVYRCLGKDSWCAIAIFTDVEWHNFVKAIGSPAWTKDPKYSTLELRKANEDEMDRLVEQWTSQYSAQEVMTIMQSVGVNAGMVQSIIELADNDPQLKHRQYFWELHHPVQGMYRNARAPYVLSKSVPELRSAPLMAEHKEYICKEILKMSDEEIAEMITNGVVE